MIPRWIHRAYAAVFGYFWLPCPFCRRAFGGHEVRSEATVVTFGDVSRTLCPRCSDLPADELTEAYHRWRSKLEQVLP